MRAVVVCLVLVQQALCLSVDRDTAAWVDSLYRNSTSNNNGGLDLTPAGIKGASQGIQNKLNDNPNLNPTNGAVQGVQNKFNDSPNLNPTDEQTEYCLNERNEKGVCVLHYLCDANTRSLITDGTTLIDVRESRECPHYLEVCCKEEKVLSVPDYERDTSNIYANSGFNELPSPTTISPQVTNTKDKCGWSNSLLHVFAPITNPKKERIYAEFGEFPWMVAVIKKSNGNVWKQNDFLGGGSLIHPSVVVTVAHNVKDKDNLKCRAGEWDTQTTKELYPFQERDVSNKIIHPDYYRTSLYYDVALLMLERPFDLALAPHIGIACLGQRMPPPGTSCYGTGWGKEFNKKGVYATTLKRVKLDLIGSDVCTNLLRNNTRLGPYFQLHESLTCAGGEERVDVCKGDGGSPLVCPVQSQENRYVVYGMVAYGIGCGSKSVPGVYANVPHLYQWVQRQMAAQGYGDLEVV